jgi:hypothetical protein
MSEVERPLAISTVSFQRPPATSASTAASASST